LDSVDGIKPNQLAKYAVAAVTDYEVWPFTMDRVNDHTIAFGQGAALRSVKHDSHSFVAEHFRAIVSNAGEYREVGPTNSGHQHLYED
jgi:hypothetical protein